jgi:hypothetical protein
VRKHDAGELQWAASSRGAQPTMEAGHREQSARGWILSTGRKRRRQKNLQPATARQGIETTEKNQRRERGYFKGEGERHGEQKNVQPLASSTDRSKNN